MTLISFITREGAPGGEGTRGAWIAGPWSGSPSSINPNSLSKLIQYPEMPGKELWRWHTDRIHVEELIYLDDHILQPATFGKTRLFLEFPVAENYHYVMDLDFFLRVIRAGVTVRKVDDLIACVRVHPETKTESGGKERFREMPRIISAYGNDRYHDIIGLFYQYTSIVPQKKYSEF